MENRLIQLALATFGVSILPREPQKRIALFHDVPSNYIDFLESLLMSCERDINSSIAITFDDGCYSSYSAALKLRHKRSVFFVCPTFIESGKNNTWRSFVQHNFLRYQKSHLDEIPNNMRPATWEELRELAAQGHSIGAHTNSHARLSHLPSRKELESEILGSADIIESTLGVEVTDFAYPFGDCYSISSRALAIIKKRFRHCHTGVRGNNALNKIGFLLWRDGLEMRWLPQYIKYILRGGLDWHYANARAYISSLEKESLALTK